MQNYIMQNYIMQNYIMQNYIMQNSRLHYSQAQINIARRNINSLRYADTTLMAESEEELQSLFMKMKEEHEKAGLKLNI